MPASADPKLLTLEQALATLSAHDPRPQRGAESDGPAAGQQFLLGHAGYGERSRAGPRIRC